MYITVNSHSSIRVESDKVVYFDPFQVKNTTHDADIIFVTHDHYDHFSPEDIAKVGQAGTVFVVPRSLAGKTGGEEVVMAPGEVATVGGFTVEAVRAYNPGKQFHPRENDWLGYIVTVEGKRLYVCGDTDATPEAMAVRCDILCVPIGGTYTMTAAEAAELTRAILPEAAVPTHYGSIVGSYEDFKEYYRLVEDKVAIWERVEDAQ